MTFDRLLDRPLLSPIFPEPVRIIRAERTGSRHTVTAEGLSTRITVIEHPVAHLRPGEEVTVLHYVIPTGEWQRAGAVSVVESP